MKTARAVGTAFLAMTLVFGLVLAFIPLGEAWVDDGTTRTTETYSMFTKERESTTSGVEATGSGATWYYVDAGLENSGGITLLTAMGPALAIGLVFILVGLILTVIPRTSPTISGGWLALPGAILIVASIVMVVLGTQLHVVDKIDTGVQVNWADTPIAIAVLTIITSLVGTGMGLVNVRNVSTTTGTTSGWVAGRKLRCPDCDTTVAAGYGVVPICPTCEFGSDYQGPAGAPVPVRPVAN